MNRDIAILIGEILATFRRRPRRPAFHSLSQPSRSILLFLALAIMPRAEAGSTKAISNKLKAVRDLPPMLLGRDIELLTHPAERAWKT